MIQPQALCSASFGTVRHGLQPHCKRQKCTLGYRQATRPREAPRVACWPGWSRARSPGDFATSHLVSLLPSREVTKEEVYPGHWVRTVCRERKCRRKKRAHLRSRQGQAGVRQASAQPPRARARTPPHPEETGKELTLIVTSSPSRPITQQPPPLRSHSNLFIHPTDSHRAAPRCQPRSRRWETTEATRMFSQRRTRPAASWSRW